MRSSNRIDQQAHASIEAEQRNAPSLQRRLTVVPASFTLAFVSRTRPTQDPRFKQTPRR